MTEEVSLVDLLNAAGVDLDEQFGVAAADRLRHVCHLHLAPLFLPYGWVDVFPAGAPSASPKVTIRTDNDAGVSPHPCNPDQLPMVSIVIDDEKTIGAMQWVSIAHLAHRDCHLCTSVWADRAAEYQAVSRSLADHTSELHTHDPYDRWSLFVRTPTDDDHAVALVHVGDAPTPGHNSHPPYRQ